MSGGKRSARAPAPRTTCSIPGSSGLRSTRPARNARDGDSTPRRSRCWRGKNISDYGALPVSQLGSLFKEVDLLGREKEIARDLVAELCSRLGFLGEVGLGYLTLDRSAPTLSGADAQRIRLASQPGPNPPRVGYLPARP